MQVVIASLAKSPVPVSTDIEARIRVLLALFQRALGDGAQVAQGQQLHPGRQRIAEDIADPSEEAKDGEEQLNGLVVRNGTLYVFALLDEAKGLGKGYFARDVICSKREKVPQLHGLLGDRRTVEPAKKSPKDLINLRFRAQDIVMKEALR